MNHVERGTPLDSVTDHVGIDIKLARERARDAIYMREPDCVARGIP